MGCACGSNTKTLTEGQKKVLEGLAQCDGPCTSKDVAAVTGLDSKVVSKEITELKKMGYADSPVRCKSGITASGRDVLKK
jgi:predicted transcriptional regulator